MTATLPPVVRDLSLGVARRALDIARDPGLSRADGARHLVSPKSASCRSVSRWLTAPERERERGVRARVHAAAVRDRRTPSEIRTGHGRSLGVARSQL